MTARALLALLLAVALVAPTGMVAGTPSPTSAADTTGSTDVTGAAPGIAQATPPDNVTNGSVRHRDPAAVGEDGSVEDLRRWLVGQLAGRLDGGAIQLSEGDYDAARRLLGDQYSKRLDQLVDVVGDTETTRTLNRTRENQEETTEAVREYRETAEEYREARENGNNTRARALGRELELISERVTRNANETRAGYGRLGNQTGADFTEASVAIANVSANVSETQAEIRDELFRETNLTASADGETVSFTDPLVVEGELRTENGTAIGDEPIRLRVGNRTYATQTDDEGRFTVTYRPVTLPVDATNVTVEFRPANRSAYLRSATTLPVRVEQVTPTVSVNRTPSAVAYNETLTVTGRVSADEVGAPAPVAVVVGDRRVARGRADGNGTYRIRVSLPASVDAGERPVRAVVPLEGRALARAEASATVTVEETATALSLDARQVADRTVQVSGRLTTASGEALGDRTVRIEHDGSELTTVRTDASGQFRTRVDVPEATPDNGTFAVNATFAGSGTNLDRAQGGATVELVDLTDGDPENSYGDGVGGQVAGLLLRNPVALASLLAGLLVLAGAGAYAVLTGSDADDDITDSVDEGVEAGGESAPEPTSATSMAALLDRARGQISEGSTDAGVVTLYAATRRLLEAGLPDEYGRTHWEFYRSARERLDGGESGVLRELTEAYERAAFSPDSTPTERAQALIERVGEFRDGDDPSAD
ncbi:DUF4129 domain-containing protein [Halomarina litorea]|uniref:DUF4129 domain-containing protein n=1 Tax=Halomarina litorea TaxID=2961595 RepID=UPI0020C547B2|nr:DUF4129 domain-containing protein [Halomarina sp. BCD28]